MLVVAAPAPLLHQAVASEQIACGADRRQLEPGIARREPGQELLGPPTWMPSARVTDQLSRLGRHTVRTAVRRAALVAESLPAGRVEAGEPFVTGLPTDAVARAELGHRV